MALFRRAVNALIDGGRHVPVASDQAAQVSTWVVRLAPRVRRCRELPHSHELRLARQVWPSTRAARAHDVLPAAIGQEAMIATCDDFRTVLERDPEGGLDRCPMSEYLGMDIAT